VFVSLIRAIFSFLGFGLACLEPYQVYYIIRELIPDQVYHTDREHLKYLELLRNTCKLFQSQIPLLYYKVCFLDKLKSQVDGWLHRLAVNIAPALPFHTNWQRHHFEFSVLITEHRKVVLWSARTDWDTLQIVESPDKAPNVCFELSLLRKSKDEVVALAYMSKTGPPPVKESKIARGTLEAVMAMYEDNFSKQLLEIKREMEENEEHYADWSLSDEDNYVLSSDYGNQLDESSQVASKTVQDSQVITIQDDGEVHQFTNANVVVVD
jgi:hypothetical protein